MTIAVLSGFILASLAPWLHRMAGSAAGWMIAVLPLGITVYLASHIVTIGAGETVFVSHPWVPSLGIHLSFHLDGLGLLFAILISGIGTLVVIYSGGYLASHPYLGRFYAYLLAFMASMLGLVLANNVITLFIFWELTGLTSYFLIGFDHERESARYSALQALLVTGVGGLMLLVGLLLLGQAGGSFELSELFEQKGVIQGHPFYLPVLFMVLVGAFTKSAQVPFHFWLPNAMEAPTPVSAYLHSATMVKAGVYLLARLNPILGGTQSWFYIISAVGAATMILGACMAFQQADLKRILAYSTVSILGALTLLLGLGTVMAVQAAMLLLLAHALYKGTLFLIAGAIDHGTGERNVNRLGGLGRMMPITAVAAGLGAISMAGIPPFLGFMSKELVYEAVGQTGAGAAVFLSLTFLTHIFLVAVAVVVGLRPFIGQKATTPYDPHEGPVSLWVGPLFLAVLGFITGSWPALVEDSLLSPSILSVLGQPAPLELALWHGWNPTLLLSGATLAGGLGLYTFREFLIRAFTRFESVSRWGPERTYNLLLNGMIELAQAQTRWLQNGYLRVYLMVILITTVGFGSYTMIEKVGFIPWIEWTEIRFYELALAVLILLGALAAARSTSRLGAVAALGVSGYSLAMIYILFGALELGITQFLIETLMVVLFVLVLYHLPQFATLSSLPSRFRDAAIAVMAGGLMSALTLLAIGTQFHSTISDYFSRNSLAEAHGRNIVNVILVDFRALDTLGEITVLAVAGIGVLAMLKLRIEKGKNL